MSRSHQHQTFRAEHLPGERLVGEPAGVGCGAVAVAGDPEYAMALDIRHDLTHQIRTRSYQVELFEAIAGSTPAGQNTTERTLIQVPNAQAIPVRDVLETARDVATRHVEAFLAAELRGDLA